MQRLPAFRKLLLVLALAFGAVGCAPSGETVVVTDRPEPAAPTEREEAPATRPADATAALDTVQTQRFDTGKMWTFEDPPVAYFRDEYGFTADEAWLEHARMGALRFADYCSASFVSPQGLVMTNHHCARESIIEVSREGEELLETGFYAETLEAEREVPGLYVDQLVAIDDVTEQIYAAVEDRSTIEAAAQARRRAARALQERLTEEVQAAGDTTRRVEVVELYSGGRYSAYTYHRYDDVRLVMAPELDLGFFGGQPDNFTYPRYTLDVSFFRVYGPDGAPIRAEYYFPWSTKGAQEGDPVFVVGNPGTTNRLSTVSQLTYVRDITLPRELAFLRTRARILKGYIAAQPDTAEAYDLQNMLFSIQNSIKAKSGQLEGLQDPYLIARRRAAQEELRAAIAESDTLRERYGGAIDRIAQLQRAKEIVARQGEAFTYFPSPRLSSRVLSRGLYGYFYGQLRRRPGVPAEQLRQIREEALEIDDLPPGLERQFIAARLRRLREVLGASDPTVERILQGRSPEEVAEQLVTQSALVDSAGFARLLDEGFLSSGDVVVEVIKPLAALFLQVNEQVRNYATAEESFNAQLARARFAIYGTKVPPDATFTLRIADGRVQGYPYNGTYAPPHTTYFGLYNHFYTYQDSAWSLPERWQTPPAPFEEQVPLNLVSTNDITGGNSGSPLLNRALEVVGVVFDSNIQALPNTYLYTSEQARAVSVDARGILEAIDDLYDADRLVLELTEDVFLETEAAADEREASE